MSNDVAGQASGHIAWSHVLDIVKCVNQANAFPEDVKWFVKNRLKSSTTPPILNSLTVLHTVTLNGGINARNQIASSKLMQTLEKLLRKSSEPRLSAAVGQLLVDWGYLYGREELGVRAHNILAGARSRGGEDYHQPSAVALLLQDERRLGIPHFSVYRGLDFLQVYGSREGSMRADDTSSSAAVQLAKRRLEEAVTASSEGRRVSGSGGAKDSARAGLESDKKMLSLSQVMGDSDLLAAIVAQCRQHVASPGSAKSGALQALLDKGYEAACRCDTWRSSIQQLAAEAKDDDSGMLSELLLASDQINTNMQRWQDFASRDLFRHVPPSPSPSKISLPPGFASGGESSSGSRSSRRSNAASGHQEQRSATAAAAAAGARGGSQAAQPPAFDLLSDVTPSSAPSSATSAAALSSNPFLAASPQQQQQQQQQAASSNPFSSPQPAAAAAAADPSSSNPFLAKQPSRKQPAPGTSAVVVFHYPEGGTAAGQQEQQQDSRNSTSSSALAAAAAAPRGAHPTQQAGPGTIATHQLDLEALLRDDHGTAAGAAGAAAGAGSRQQQDRAAGTAAPAGTRVPMHSSQPGSTASGAASVDSFHTARSELLSSQVRSSPSGSRSTGVHGNYAAQLAQLHESDAGPAPGGWPSGSRGYPPASAPGSQHSQPYSSKHSSGHSSSSRMDAEGHPQHGSGHHPAQYAYPGPGTQAPGAVPRKVTGGGGGPVVGSSGAEWLVQLEALMSDLANHPYKCQACQSPSWKMVTSEVRRLVQAMQAQHEAQLLAQQAQHQQELAAIKAQAVARMRQVLASGAGQLGTPGPGTAGSGRGASETPPPGATAADVAAHAGMMQPGAGQQHGSAGSSSGRAAAGKWGPGWAVDGAEALGSPAQRSAEGAQAAAGASAEGPGARPGPPMRAYSPDGISREIAKPLPMVTGSPAPALPANGSPSPPPSESGSSPAHQRSAPAVLAVGTKQQEQRGQREQQQSRPAGHWQ